MVLQGGAGVTPHAVESLPVEGLTETAAVADTRQTQPTIDAHTSQVDMRHPQRVTVEGDMKRLCRSGAKRGREVSEYLLLNVAKEGCRMGLRLLQRGKTACVYGAHRPVTAIV